MRPFISRLCLLIICPTTGLWGTEGLDYWPQWRGPLATGVSPNGSPPLQWDEETNIRWKLDLPGKGHATPIVWGDRIFLTAAVPYGEELPPVHSQAHGTHHGVPVTHRHQFVVIAVDREHGRILWQKTVHRAQPHEGGHYTGSLASNSPVTDGTTVFAFFGSNGLYALDFEGNLIWQTDLGDMQTKHGHGEGSSPALYGKTLVVNWDHEGQSFIVAFDKSTGEQRWKTLRDEVSSWATPIVVEHAGKPQLIVSGTNRLRGYDLETGKVIWECGGLPANLVASPVSSNGLVIAGGSYDSRAMLAVRLEGAHGDIAGTDRVAWRLDRGTPYVPSPLLYDESLYFLSHYQGVLSRVRIQTGEMEAGPLRLPGIDNVYASPVGAANRVYITDLSGNTLVIDHGKGSKVLGVNRLDDRFSASAAIAGNDLFLRGERFLYRIAEPP